MLLRHIASHLTTRGASVINVNAMVIAEAPKIAPHVAAMRAFLAPLLHIDPARIAIKATTMEKLGAIGDIKHVLDREQIDDLL